MIRTMILWGLYWGPLFMKAAINGVEFADGRVLGCNGYFFSYNRSVWFGGD